MKIQLKNLDLFYIPGAVHDAVEETCSGIVANKLKRSRHIRVSVFNDILYTYNSKSGNVSTFDVDNGLYISLNIANANEFVDCKGFCVDEKHYYFLLESQVLIYNRDFSFQRKIELSFDADDFCIYDEVCYFVNNASSEVVIIRGSGTDNVDICEFEIKGIAKRSINIIAGNIWICEEEENEVYVYNPISHKLEFSLITPFIAPQAVVAIGEKIYVLYAGITTVTTYDDVSFQQQKPFLHHLIFNSATSAAPYIATNSFIIELTYEEQIDLSHSDEKYADLNLYIALPLETERQEILGIDPVGMKFELIEKNGYKYAHFKLGAINSESAGVVGYKVKLKLSGIKYQLEHSKAANPDVLPQAIKKEIVDYEDIGTNLPFIQDFAKIERSGDLLKDVLTLRNKVFDALYYRRNNYATNIAEVIKDGYGACGDYSSIILALLKLNDIPARSVGGFKVTRFNNSQQELVTNYYNHTWIEFYSAEYGWLPMESSSDDKEIDGRFCEGQFLGEDWTHIRTHYNKSMPNFIHCFDGNAEVDPYDIFTNMIYERLLGEAL